MRWRLAGLGAAGLLLCCRAGAADPADFAYRQRLGAQLPLAVTLREADGGATAVAALVRDRPTIWALGYFHCPNLCGVVREDLFHALGGAGLVAGRDYELATLSIDPAETAADARAARAQDVAAFGRPGAAAAWHYLTGSPEAVRQVAEAVGFRDRADTATKQFFHPAGVVIASPGGVVSGYLLGVGYTPSDMRAAVARAAAGRIGGLVNPVLLFCFHYDPRTGRYTLAIVKVLRLAAALTVLTLGGTLLLAWRRRA